VNFRRACLFLAPLLLGTSWATPPQYYAGVYASPTGVLELHRAPESDLLRGYLRDGDRIAALSPVELIDGVLKATATYDDGTSAELSGRAEIKKWIVLDGRSKYVFKAAETPTNATVRRAIEEAYARLAAAVESKDFEAFQALRVAEFATIPPNGIPSPGARMEDRARGMLERIQPPISTTNEILELTARGGDAIATVRQTFIRMQMVEGTLHEIHTEVTQRETWTRTAQGWKLLWVDEVRDHVTWDNGRQME
jgi:ketosteroid isomerase-like protein